MSNTVISQAEFEAEDVIFQSKLSGMKGHGQLLFARIRPSSKYYGKQGKEGELFPIAIQPGRDYNVSGGPGGQYRLTDVDLFAVWDAATPPIQITFNQ